MTIDRDSYEAKLYELNKAISQLREEGASLQNSSDNEDTIKRRILDFRRTLEENETLTVFDRHVFESIVDKVIVGGIDDDGNKDPSLLTFIYKTGFTNNIKGTPHKPERKNAKRRNDKLCSDGGTEASAPCSPYCADTCGDGCVVVEGGWMRVRNL